MKFFESVMRYSGRRPSGPSDREVERATQWWGSNGRSAEDRPTAGLPSPRRDPARGQSSRRRSKGVSTAVSVS